MSSQRYQRHKTKCKERPGSVAWRQTAGPACASLWVLFPALKAKQNKTKNHHHNKKMKERKANKPKAHQGRYSRITTQLTHYPSGSPEDHSQARSPWIRAPSSWPSGGGIWRTCLRQESPAVSPTYPCPAHIACAPEMDISAPSHANTTDPGRGLCTPEKSWVQFKDPGDLVAECCM